MTDRQEFTISDTNRGEIALAIAQLVYSAPAGYVVAISEAARTILQNKKLWPMLTDISRQVRWDDETLTPIEWKDWFTAALRQQRMVRGMDARTIVFVGESTRGLSKREFSDLIELMYAFGSERFVVWSEKSKQNFAELRRQTAAPAGAAQQEEEPQ